MKYRIVQTYFSGDANTWIYTTTDIAFDNIEAAILYIENSRHSERLFIKIGDKSLPKEKELAHADFNPIYEV